MKLFKLSREVKTGVLTLLTLAAFIWGYNFIIGRNVFKSQRIFYAHYENVAGLMTANTVTINGLQVGQVNKMYFHPKNQGQVVVEILMSSDVPVPINSLARIYSSDLLGTRGIMIIQGDSPILAVDGDTLISETQLSLKDELNDMVEPIMKKTGDLMSSFDTILASLNDVFNKDTRDNLISTVTSLKNTIQNLEHSTQTVDTLVNSQKTRLSHIVANVESISENLKNNNKNLTRIINNVALLSDSLAQVDISGTMNKVTNAVTGLNSIVQKIEKGEGSLGQLVNNEKVYNDLESASKGLNLLIEDIRINPNRYVHFSVFGRTATKKSAQEAVE